MQFSMLQTKYHRSTGRKVVVAIAFASLISGLSISSAFADRNDNQGQGDWHSDHGQRGHHEGHGHRNEHQRHIVTSNAAMSAPCMFRPLSITNPGNLFPFLVDPPNLIMGQVRHGLL